MFPGGNRISCMVEHIYPGWDVHHRETAQHLITAGYDLDDLDRDLSRMPDMCEKRLRR